MATWAQIQTAVINQTNAGNIPWERMEGEDSPIILYRAVYKGFIVQVFTNKVQIKYREKSRTKMADMTTVRTAIENYLTDTGEALALDAIYTLLTT